MHYSVSPWSFSTRRYFFLQLINYAFVPINFLFLESKYRNNPSSNLYIISTTIQLHPSPHTIKTT